MENTKTKRVLLKLSGAALQGKLDHGIDTSTVRFVASEIHQAVNSGFEIALVVGGGNWWRGADAAESGMDRASADYSGMLATIINGIALQDALEKEGISTRTQSAITIQAVAEPFIRRRAIRHLEKGRTIVFVGGTGNPFVTTDTSAALRSLEIVADYLLMAKNNVDGVYDSDPQKNSSAKKFSELKYLDVLNLKLDVMDSTALSLCMDNNLPIVVFDLFNKGNLLNILQGNNIGTKIS